LKRKKNEKKKLLITWLLLVLIIWFESNVFVDWLVDDSVGVILVLEAISLINFVCLLLLSSFSLFVVINVLFTFTIGNDCILAGWNIFDLINELGIDLDVFAWSI
jgi:hypothetical protein